MLGCRIPSIKPAGFSVAPERRERKAPRPSLAGAALLGARKVRALAKLRKEKDPQAAALGYVIHVYMADRAKCESYAPDQAFSNCAHCQEKPNDATAGCPMFASRVVSARSWCSAHIKKAGDGSLHSRRSACAWIVGWHEREQRVPKRRVHRAGLTGEARPALRGPSPVWPRVDAALTAVHALSAGTARSTGFTFGAARVPARRAQTSVSSASGDVRHA